MFQLCLYMLSTYFCKIPSSAIWILFIVLTSIPKPFYLRLSLFFSPSFSYLCLL